MNWEDIAQAGHEVFQRVILENGISVGSWENLTHAERTALIEQAKEIIHMLTKAMIRDWERFASMFEDAP